jgi:flagellar protein FliS
MMVIDQLDASLARAQQGYEKNDLYEIHTSLKNAQAIVALLRDSLQLDIWDGAVDIYRLYEFALDRLVRSNLNKDRTLLEEAQEVLGPLMDAWRQAAQITSADDLASVNG